MASVKVKFRPSSVNGKEGSIYYQMIHNRVVRQIRTDYRIFESEWDDKASTVIVPELTGTERKNHLQSVVSDIEWDVKRLKTIIALYERGNKSYTSDDIILKFNRQADEQSLFSFMKGVIEQLKRLNRIRTSETYTVTLASFMKFRDGQDILLCEIDGDVMMLYEAWLKANSNCPNTISFYMRILRAVYNRAVEKELVEQKFPFKHVYTGIYKTVKRAISLKTVKRIKEIDLKMKPHLDYARDMFLFSFYTRGMSFVDMAYLKKSDLENGILTYRRRKTGQLLTVKWEKCMGDIVAKYEGHSDTQYLLPIITDLRADERIQYRNALCRVNIALKEIARLVGLALPLSMYCARHAWASIAKSKNIPLAVISEGMGHDSEETTRIYLASLDTSVVDKANSLILKDL
ncbi:site-specific integrase [Phocaeicola plebeius]|uniref:tyrosine-type recombinase/integrase n=1 Tax=Phocaeicola plebeius TaxID=310297 RepID=UPI00266C3414|nr:site-specific integrase [Phocaeicola plebeius]